jgi:hypothetical protein
MAFKVLCAYTVKPADPQSLASVRVQLMMHRAGEVTALLEPLWYTVLVLSLLKTAWRVNSMHRGRYLVLFSCAPQKLTYAIRQEDFCKE